MGAEQEPSGLHSLSPLPQSPTPLPIPLPNSSHLTLCAPAALVSEMETSQFCIFISN